MKKIISVLLICCMMAMTFTACGNKKSDSTSSTKTGDVVTDDTSSTKDSTVADSTSSAEIVDGKFVETRQITVEVYDRSNDGGSKPDDNVYTNFIKEGMLRDHNVEVTFVSVPRWTEVEELNNLLAANKAPDICVTYDYPTVLTYAQMGGVLELSSFVDDNKELLPNLWGYLGETNMYWEKDPVEGTIWAIDARLNNLSRNNTFVREDWLKKLNIAEPTSLEEFEAMLIAFRDNADTLLGADADKMVPFSISYDVGYRGDHMLCSYIPDDITEKDYYINGFDDRKLLMPGYKDGIKKLNEWYNKDLIWKDFPLYPAGDTTEDDMLQAGYIGAFIHNWDYPYRNGDDSIHNSLKRIAGDDATYIPVECFKNNAGKYKKFLGGPNDRKLFFPATNDEPIASLMYLDWITKLENREFLQIGEEGVTHETQADGSIKTIATSDDSIMNSPFNIDYTITINGLDLGDPDKTLKSIALGYQGVDAKYIEKAFEITSNEGRITKNAKVGDIPAEQGMGPVLSEKRNTMLDQAVVATPDKFDQVFDTGLEDYLASGGQAIINERKEAWEKIYGDATDLPE